MAIRKASRSSKVEDHIVDKVGITEQTSKGALEWEATKGEVESTTTLEDDQGHGPAVIVRSFDFRANPEAFRAHIPSKQELFNAHAKQIEILLWKDGMQVMPDVNPKVMISKNKQNYRIVVGAEPSKGNLLHQRPQTLTEITNGLSTRD